MRNIHCKTCKTLLYFNTVTEMAGCLNQLKRSVKVGVALLTVIEHKFTENIIFSPSWEKPLYVGFIGLSK